ncbi:hypothetical protein BKA93DRAFT_793938 [Sparassis latifolia]|uniref:Hyaluronan/mRNA-binding protein domain-containing protein n=1 Tax=Sparassis crispa TaxID=139825 RepID=A0A401G7Y6_9APHY|nr:hypothetical protein SCP_0111680 [Sparassis crispa]GBE78285.1 hypothetical protein SCP_0111680 [Sparassis crispa]
MSVASKNPFAILEDEDASQPSTPAPAPATADASASPAPTRGTQRGRGGPASRGGRYYQRGGKSAPSGEKENQDSAEDTAAGEAPKRRFDGEGRGRGRGRGRGGDRGGDRGSRGGRGRPFDRHSQTGKVDSEKKVHQGWGGDEGSSELKAEDAAVADAVTEALGATTTSDDWAAPATTAADDWGTSPPAGDQAAAPEGEKAGEREGRRPRDREVEEEDNTLTFDQYLKQQKELEIVPKLEVRKANEGDDSIWKDAVVMSKKDVEEKAYFVGKSKTAAPKARPKKEEKVFLEIDARFERPQRGGRGRGGDRGEGRGRGRGRGGGGRGRANGGGAAAPALDVDDQTAFPSLA